MTNKRLKTFMSHIHLVQMKWIGTYNHVHNGLDIFEW